MEIENAIELNNSRKNAVNLEEKQNSFLNTMLGKAINTGIDAGIRILFPDFIENQIINIKDNLLKFDLKDGISKIINGAINLGKSSIGILTGNLQDINQIKKVIEKGELIDSFSKIFDTVLEKAASNKQIDADIVDIIKKGKDSILKSIESNIEKSLSNQIDKSVQLDEYINNWKDAYKNQDFTNMEKQYKKINKELKSLVPMENSIKEARIIENIHSLIKTNGKNFDLSETEKELINKLF